MPTLYHYCSNESFHSIVSTAKLRLSSLTLSSDFMEGKLVAQSLARLAKADGLSAEYTEHIQSSIRDFEYILDGLGFCMSEEGDLLSQWRGYANDGFGVSIGFSSEYLEWFAEAHRFGDPRRLALSKVQYGESENDSFVREAYDRVKERIAAGTLKALGGDAGTLLSDIGDLNRAADRHRLARREARQLLNAELLKLIPKLFLLKSDAFREEQEWRLVALHIPGGDSAEPLYRAQHNRIVPFREYELKEKMERKPIAKIVLGPKHVTPVNVIEGFLLGSGFGSVPVERSTATYR